MERRFTTNRPHQLWVAYITYVRILTGFCYVAFITDVFTRRIVGWAVSSSLRIVGLPLLALEHALVTTGASPGPPRPGAPQQQGLTVRQLGALRCAHHRRGEGLGTVGNSYNNTLTETVNGLYKAELIHSQRLCESTETVGLATMGWGHWWNSVRIHEALAYHTSTEAKTAYTHHQDIAPLRPDPGTKPRTLQPATGGTLPLKHPQGAHQEYLRSPAQGADFPRPGGRLAAVTERRRAPSRLQPVIERTSPADSPHGLR